MFDPDTRAITRNRNRVLLACVFASLLGIFSNVKAATVVTQTGFASPQSDLEKNNVERLRERAIRNALNLALMQVTGATISGQRSDSLGSKESYSSAGETTTENVDMDSQFRGSSLSRTSGHVRLLEILDEGAKDQQYFVTIKAAVDDEKDLTAKNNAGFYWNRIGKPTVTLDLAEIINGQKSELTENYTKRYFLENFADNGIQLSANSTDPEYRIHLIQDLNIGKIADLGTYTTHCKLSYQIIGRDNASILAEDNFRNGPSAGFTVEQSTDSCLKPLAPKAAGKTIKAFAGILNDQWNNGAEYSIAINNLPGQYLNQSITALSSAFGVSGLATHSYDDHRLFTQARFKGSVADLIASVLAAFEDTGIKLESVKYQGNALTFQWIAETN